MSRIWNIYLSGEIHTDWRERIQQGVQAAGLEIVFLTPVTDHARSDDCGVDILGQEENNFWHDHKGAKINDPELTHALKEVDAAAQAVCQTPEQVVEILKYVIQQA